MKTKSPILLRLLAVTAVGLLGLIALWSCKLGAEVEVEEVFTFPALADSLAGNDHAVIFLKDSTSGLLDTLFNGPITAATQFEALVARKYKGGKVNVITEGFKGGNLNYKRIKLYDGAIGAVERTDSVDIRPVSEGKVDSMKVGLTRDSVTVSPDTLLLFTGGEAHSLTAALHPDTLPLRIAWRSALPGIAAVDSTGKVRPVAAGRTYVRAISLEDSTRRDSALVLVRKDPPRIQIGRDTTISVGQTLTYLPDITQDHGTITQVRWDLDGNGVWDDSSTAPKSVSYRYAEAKEYGTRFSARDSEGNDTTVTRKVRSVAGPVILFIQPADGSHTNQSPIAVTWSVDGVVQTSSEVLKPGANVITRSATAGGATYSASLTVHLDTEPPARPLVKGPQGPVSSLRPAWSWEPAGGGNGTFRFRLDSDNFTVGATVGTDTTFTPGTNLTGGSHALYVQERDLAGNWSLSGSFTVRIDTTPPPPPVVTVQPASPTNNRRPTWSWMGSVSEGKSTYRYKLDNSDFRTGATVVSAAAFTPAPGAELPEGIHVLYVQHQDSAGNWSLEGSAKISVDLTVPTAPTVTGPASPTNDDTPTWTWTAGTGGSGTFRYRLDDTTMAGGTETSQLTFTPAALASGSHTLHVQERDSAGNWSPRGSYSVVIDRTPPSPPTMNVSLPRSPLNSLRPTWFWTSGGGGNGTFQVKVGNDDFSTGATTVTATSYTPPANLEQGARTLYVRERDTAQNWSTAASRMIFLAPRDTLERLGFSENSATNLHIRVSSNGVVYAAYFEAIENRAVVKQYQPGTNNWVDAGSGLCNSFSVKILVGLDGGRFSWRGQVEPTHHPLLMDLLQHRRHQAQA